MNRFLKIVFVAAFGTVLLHADERAENKLADAAFASGDYANAISGYRNAMLLADQNNDPESWALNALKLADVSLRDGDLRGARAVYAEFRRRHPLRSAGTLPGDLLAAEGKFAEAEKFFASLPTNDPELAAAALFSRGMVKMRSGNIAGAYELFSQLAKRTSSWAEQGKYEAVYALIHLKKYAEALAELGTVAPEKRSDNWELLRYLAEAYSGKNSELKKNFTAFIEKQPPKPHIRLMELLSVAAKSAAANKDTAFAAQLLNTALTFAPEESVKRELLRRLINVYAQSDPERAVAESRRYVSMFPGAADRSSVLLAAGKLLNRKNMPDAASDIFTSLARNRNFQLSDRLAAAAEIIAMQGKTKKKIAPEEFYTMLGDNSPDAAQKSLWRSRFAAYLEQKGDRNGALNEYLRALHAAPEAEREAVHFAIMNFCIRTGDKAGIRKEANFLSGSRHSRYRAAAKYELGKLAEKSGDLSNAGKFYREAANISGTPVTIAAGFQAAAMSLKLQEFTKAGNEFIRFAQKYPKAQEAPDALYHAITAFTAANNKPQAFKTAQLLKKNYPESEALAYHVINEARERGESGDPAGAVAELETLEDVFANTAAGAEALLLKAIFMEKHGSIDDALKEFQELAGANVAAAIASESAIRAGEILFRRGEFPAARKSFLRAAALNPGGLFADVATGRAVDCDLVNGSSPDPAYLDECRVRCEQLAITTKFPQIRIQALYKLGLCNEHAGDYENALRAYEKLLYAVTENRKNGIIPDPQWCIRSTEAALNILVRHRLPGALQRGMRLINHLEKLKLTGVSGSEMRKNFREQLKTIRRK